MSLQTAPDAFLQLNSLQTKEVILVVDIDGVDYLTTRTISQKIRYGDPINYGDTDLVYGGMRPVGTGPNERHQRSLIMLEGGSFTISQRLEPEQGRGAVSTLTISFLDKDQYMTQVVSPGVIVEEILGREVKIWLGYTQNSFPDEYYVVWRGRVSQVNIDPGRVTLQFSDPNIGRRQQIFYMPKTKLSAGITAGSINIPVVSNGDFHEKIVGPDGTYNTSVKCYLKIENEFIEYQQVGAENTGFGSNVFTGVIRGARGTTAASHAINSDVTAYLELSDHAITMALRLMLSGWGDNFVTDVPVFSFNNTTDPVAGYYPYGIMLPIGVDAVRDYGIQSGDYITVTDSGEPGNNGVCRVVGFADAFEKPNQVIITDKIFAIEVASPAMLAFRSQYDVYPVTCGAKLTPNEVDVGGHVYFQNTFLGAGENSYRFFLSGPTTCKEFIENQIFLPIGAFSLTRQGKISMGYSSPPIADQRTLVLDSNNVIDPQNIRPSRGLNNRKFFNQIDWTWDFDDSGNSTSTLKRLDSDSLSLIRVSSVLPISSQGSRTDLGFLNVVERRNRFLLGRYARGGILYTFKTFFGVGNQIEAGDVLILKDEGRLQITNMNTGERNLGVELMQVIDRQLDLKSGNVQITLQGGLGSALTDRFATVAPSSLVAGGSTTSRVRIKESFGELFISQEFKKWTDYVGLKITVHNKSWTFSETVTLLGFASDDNHAMLVDPPLSIVPPEDYRIDLELYPDTTDAADQQLTKLVHTYLTKTINVIGGSDNFTFQVALVDMAYLQINDTIQVHNNSYSNDSGEVKIVDIVGTSIIVDTDMGFTPAIGMRLDLTPFLDRGLPYRFV